MMEIIQTVTLEDVRNAKPQTIWYAARTCWWTHRGEDLSTLPPTPDDIRRAAEMFRLNSQAPDAPLDEFMERARNASHGLPCDPRGSVLFMTDEVEAFLSTAEKNAAHYGKHGLRAFMAAHHRNCIESGRSLRPWSAATWDEYNDAIDRFDEKLKRLAETAKAKFVELEKETKFTIPQIYLPLVGGPLYWRDEESGVLPEAINALLNKSPTDEQLSLVREYFEYYIHAPCWNFADAFAEELAELRESSKTMRTLQEIFDWLYRALDIGIDPI